MTIEQIDSELEKYKPIYGKIGNYLSVLKKERDKVSNDTTVEDAKAEMETALAESPK